MDQLDAQLSDLRNLSQAPRATSAASSAYSPPLSALPGDNSAGLPPTPTTARHGSTKRRPEDEEPSGKQQRSKRNRYISIACNECKRRKIKCNGETPCQRCGNLGLQCLYAPNCCSNSFKDSDEYREMSAQMSQLQEQVNGLMHTMSTLRSDTLRLAPIHHDGRGGAPLRPPSISPSPSTSLSSIHRPDGPPIVTPLKPGPSTFRGPTSMAFSLDVANNTIHEMGYKGISGTETAAEEVLSLPPPPGMFKQDSIKQPSQMRSGSYATGTVLPAPVIEPLYEFDKDELVRLCRAHDEEVGIMYPVVNIHTVIAHARGVAAAIEAAVQQGQPPALINDDQTLVLKMVMCCALVVEEHGNSDKAARVLESCEAIINKKLMVDPADVANLPLLALLAGYRFLSNDEILAWRVMGQVVRLCLEMGIHQRSGLMKIQDDEARRNALNSFWSAYVLDRRWAFATGLPYVTQDEEIDPNLPLPDEFPYLVAMITYSRLGAKVWRQVSHFGPVLARELRQEEMESLDHEILQWYETVPEEVKLRNWDKEKKMTSTPSYNLQRLRIWTYLRFNQIRIWLYTPILHSATSIMGNFAQAQRVVHLAKDTIRYLTHLNNTTNLYRKIQVFYHQFLTSAIAVVFLASVHAPVSFSATCRDEFFMALELVKDLSAKSWVSKRLWRTIGSLKEVAPRVGLRRDDGDAGRRGTGTGAGADAHETAALAMAGMASGGGRAGSESAASVAGRAGHGGVSPAPAASGLEGPPLPLAPRGPMAVGTPPDGDNGIRIQTEMTRIFENYVGVDKFLAPGGEELSNGGLPTPDSAASGFGTNGNVFHLFREMF